jgi:ADP-heptose:LPS heptosyltransferase
MRIETQRKIDRTAGTWICRVLSLFPVKTPPKRFRPSKILVILLSEMGSLVLARPMLDLIKTKYPSSSLYGLCFEKNREFLEILDIISPSKILTIRADSFCLLFNDTLRVYVRMRREKMDTVLDCELFSRISSIYSFLSGAEVRVGFHPHTQEGLYRGNYINRPVLYNPHHHISHQFINLVEAIESDGAPKVKRAIPPHDCEIPGIRIAEKTKEEFLKRFQKDYPHVIKRKLVLLYPSGGLLPIRTWPLQNYCRVAEVLLKEGYAVAVIGMKSDHELAKEIQSYCRSENCIDLTGYTGTILELMALFHVASLLISNDGGPGHFASMTPIPSILLYGPESPSLYGALGRRSVKLHTAFSCSPCLTAYNHRHSPCDGDNRCLKSITPEVVLNKAYYLLEGQEKSIS